METLKKIERTLGTPFRYLWYGLMAIFLVIGMWIVDIATRRGPDDNTG